MATDIRGFDDEPIRGGDPRLSEPGLPPGVIVTDATITDPEGDDLMRVRPDEDPRVSPDESLQQDDQAVPPDGIPVVSDQPDVEPARKLIRDATPTGPREEERVPRMVTTTLSGADRMPEGIPVPTFGACARCGEPMLNGRAEHEDAMACLLYLRGALRDLRREHAEVRTQRDRLAVQMEELRPIAERIASFR